MPTTRPRYTVTDTGELTEMLDLAARRWPKEPHRKDLLIRLAEIGRDVIAREVAEADGAERRERQREALRRLDGLLDENVLRSDAAWR